MKFFIGLRNGLIISLFLWVAIFLCISVFATDYYVATDGSGDYTTIAQVNAASFSAGDNIYFHRGHTWREELFTDSGSLSGYITYSAYGGGNKPLLLGSTEENETSDWTDEGGNIWSNNDATFTIDVGNLIFNNEDSVGVKLFVEGDVDTQGEFWYDEDNDLIKLYSTSNPASFYTDIECALRRNIITSNDNFVIIENLDLRYGGGGLGINFSGTNLVVIPTETFTAGEWNILFCVANGTNAPQAFLSQNGADLTEVTYGTQTSPTGTVIVRGGTSTMRIAGRLNIPSDGDNGRIDVQQIMMWSDVKSLAQCKVLRWAPFGKWRQSTSLCQVWLSTNAEAMNFGFSAQPSHTGTPTQADSPPSSMPFGFDEPWIPGVTPAILGNPWYHYAQTS